MACLPPDAGLMKFVPKDDFRDTWRDWENACHRQARLIKALEGKLCEPQSRECRGCRFWGGEQASEDMGRCHVSGSFKAGRKFLTEPEFCCVHWSARRL
jgi:hypothetical protein